MGRKVEEAVEVIAEFINQEMKGGMNGFQRETRRFWVWTKGASVETKIKFGTDGWRGRIAEEYTFDNVRRCAQGYANYLEELDSPGADIIVGMKGTGGWFH